MQCVVCVYVCVLSAQSFLKQGASCGQHHHLLSFFNAKIDMRLFGLEFSKVGHQRSSF